MLCGPYIDILVIKFMQLGAAEVDMSYSKPTFGCNMVQYPLKTNTSGIILRINTTTLWLGWPKVNA